MRKSLFFLSCTILVTTLHGQHRIAFFIKEYPSLDGLEIEQKVLNLNPQKAISKIKQAPMNSYPVPGVFATYAGYGMFSNHDGLIMFPRKHLKPIVYLVITPMIEPVLMLGKTVHHWNLLPNCQCAMYKIERKQNPDTMLYYWETTKEALPANNIIPLNSVILIARAQDIFVPLGATLTNSSEQLILPDIYAHHSIHIAMNSIRILSVRHFFEFVTMIWKKGSDTSWMVQEKE